jgi:hypothetical protein
MADRSWRWNRTWCLAFMEGDRRRTSLIDLACLAEEAQTDFHKQLACLVEEAQTDFHKQLISAQYDIGGSRAPAGAKGGP